MVRWRLLRHEKVRSMILNIACTNGSTTSVGVYLAVDDARQRLILLVGAQESTK